MKTITIKLYANIRTIVGENQLSLDLPDEETIGDLKALLIRRYPRLRTLLDNVLFVVDSRILLESNRLPPDATVVILPRIGGG